MTAPAGTASGELPVITKTYDLLQWTIGRVEKFPRSHRFTLGTRLQSQLHDLLDMLIESRFAQDKAHLLQRCSVSVEQIRMSFRLACELRVLAVNSHEYACRHLLEIGRQIGGWRRQQEQISR